MMHKIRQKGLACGAVLMLLTLVTGGCHSFQETIEVGVLPEDELYELGMQKFNAEEWDHSIAVFNRFERLYVNSDKVQQARLLRADAYYNKGRTTSYIMAKSEYQGFVALYPNYDDADYVWMRIAQCSYHQILPPNRDQTQTEESIKDFQSFLQRFPDSEHVPEVREMLQQSYTHMAEHHIVVGTHYYMRKLYAAAAERFRMAIQQDVSVADPESLLFHLAVSLARASNYYAGIYDFAMRVNQESEAPRYRKLYERYTYEAKQYLAEFKDRFPQSTSRITIIEREINSIQPLETIQAS